MLAGVILWAVYDYALYIYVFCMFLLYIHSAVSNWQSMCMYCNVCTCGGTCSVWRVSCCLSGIPY